MKDLCSIKYDLKYDIPFPCSVRLNASLSLITRDSVFILREVTFGQQSKIAGSKVKDMAFVK